MIPITAVLIALFWPAVAAADLDISISRSTNRSADVTATLTRYDFFSPATTETATREVDFDYLTLSAKGVSWNKTHPAHGFAMAFTYSGLNGDTIDVGLFSLSFFYMGRMRLLTSNSYKDGRFQPYLGIGIQLLYGYGSFDFRPEISGVVEGNGGTMGIEMYTGLRWFFSPRWATHLEVRYFKANLDLESSFLFSDNTAEIDLELGQLLIGVSMVF